MVAAASATPRTTGSGGTTTSASFSPASGVLLVACVGSDSGSTTLTTHTVTGGSLTWTEREHSDVGSNPGRSGAASIWTAVSAGASMTVTAAGGPDTISLQVYTASGQAGSPIGAGSVGSTVTAANTASVFTSTGASSLLFFSANDWAQTGVATSSDMTITTYNVATFVSGFAGFKGLGSIGAQTAQFTWPSAPDCVWAALEVLDGGTTPPQVQPVVAPSWAVARASTW